MSWDEFKNLVPFVAVIPLIFAWIILLRSAVRTERKRRIEQEQERKNKGKEKEKSIKLT